MSASGGELLGGLIVAAAGAAADAVEPGGAAAEQGGEGEPDLPVGEGAVGDEELAGDAEVLAEAPDGDGDQQRGDRGEEAGDGECDFASRDDVGLRLRGAQRDGLALSKLALLARAGTALAELQPDHHREDLVRWLPRSPEPGAFVIEWRRSTPSIPYRPGRNWTL